MDIQMPVMNGYDATRAIKKIRPELPIIALTAYAFDQDKKSCKDAGCNDFLAKPVRRNDLLQKLGDLLAR
jgi:CheY-like chemotaxis protein